MMERRYESYKAHVVRPFFRDHFARLDRQIVLVDALSALNSGPAAVRDLQNALTDVLQAFRAGRSNLLSTLFRPRIDRILFAATKADHLHHTSHDRLEAILRLLVARAIARAEDVGAGIDVIALAAVRATREAAVQAGRETLDAIVGTPLPGESIDGETFDGLAEAAIFPGELPADPKVALRGDGLALAEGDADYRFVRFRPPLPETTPEGAAAAAPHPARPGAAVPARGQARMTLPDDRPENRPGARPRAFRLDTADPARAWRRTAQFRSGIVLEPQDDAYAREAALVALPRRGGRHRGARRRSA